MAGALGLRAACRRARGYAEDVSANFPMKLANADARAHATIFSHTIISAWFRAPVFASNLCHCTEASIFRSANECSLT